MLATVGGDPGRTASDRLLSAVGTDPAALAAAKLRAFRRFAVLLVAAESWHALHYPAYRAEAELHLAIACFLSAAAVLGWSRRFARLGTGAVALGAFADLVSVFPENANHQYLGVLVAAALTLAPDGDDESAVPVLQALRFIVPIGFFWAGFQKVFWGYWFGGEFLAVRISTDSSFAMVFAPLLSADEYARLASLVPGIGAGPYRVGEPLFLLVSNGAWLAEIVLAPALLFARTRWPAAIGVVLFMVAIETAARELFFGMLMVSLALLYAPFDASRRALPVFAVAIAYLLATSAGLLPGWSFG